MGTALNETYYSEQNQTYIDHNNNMTNDMY